jgi:hypothetical protein
MRADKSPESLPGEATVLGSQPTGIGLDGEFLEVSAYGRTGEILDAGEGFVVGVVEHGLEGISSFSEGFADAALAVQSMLEQPAECRRWIVDHGAMSGTEAIGSTGVEAAETRQVGPHVSVGSSHDDTPLRDREVATQDVFDGGAGVLDRSHSEGNVLGGVTGGVENGSRTDSSPIDEASVGFDTGRVGELRFATESCPDGRVGSIGVLRHGPDVIGMGVGDGEMIDAGILDGCIELLTSSWRIDEKRLLVPDEIRGGATGRRSRWDFDRRSPDDLHGGTDGRTVKTVPNGFRKVARQRRLR